MFLQGTITDRAMKRIILFLSVQCQVVIQLCLFMCIYYLYVIFKLTTSTLKGRIFGLITNLFILIWNVDMTEHLSTNNQVSLLSFCSFHIYIYLYIYVIYCLIHHIYSIKDINGTADFIFIFRKAILYL